MIWSEIVFGTVLVVMLVLVSVVYGWRQLQQLRRLRSSSLPDEEMRWETRKAWRRLVSSGLTFVMALLLVGLLAHYEPAAQRFADEAEALAPGERPE